MGQTKEPRITSMHTEEWLYQQSRLWIDEEGVSSSKNGCKKPGIHMKKYKIKSLPHTIHKKIPGGLMA